ncbi:MAG: hypothetical protein ACOC5T_09245 [Elusimicrobiota bacterium]
MKKEKSIIFDAVVNVANTSDSNKTSVDIYSDGENSPSIISFADIKKYSKKRIRDSLKEWKNNDFAMYFLQQFYKNTDSEQQIRLLGMTMNFPYIRKSVKDVLGFCDNIVLKDYIDFFVLEWLNFFINRDGKFRLRHVYDDKAIDAFVSEYNYERSLMSYLNSSEEKNDVDKNIDLESLYLSGGASLLLGAGLILPVNWLMEKKHFSYKKAHNYIASVLKKSYNDIIEDVLDKTEELSPYPTSFKVKKCDNIFEVAQKDKHREIDVVFIDTARQYFS